MSVVIGTAGHIDHGKTTLLRALTGIDADRLPEERRRGMTIDVGYAHLTLPDGTDLDFVDVPGHDRLVGNMLVGAGEIDAAMLVVAADDGPRTQTLEHLALLDALGIGHGIAVVTKGDLAGPERTTAVMAELARLLAGTTLAGSPVLAASPADGAGIEAVRAALVEVGDRVRGAAGGSVDGRWSRAAIDRAFSVKGRGAVVTGTLRGGPLAAGAILRLVPGDRAVRVREVQVHGERVEIASAGRTALNVTGVDATDLHRGLVLTDDPAITASDRLLVRLTRALPDRTRARMHLGTVAADVAIGRSGRDEIDLPSGGVAAIVRVSGPVAVAVGDRFVLRRASGGDRIVGGIVLDARPSRGVSRRRQTPERVGRLAAAVGADDRPAVATARIDLHGVVVAADGRVHVAPDIAATSDATVIAGVAAGPGARATLADVRVMAARSLRRQATLDRTAATAAGTAMVDALVGAGRLIRAGTDLHLPGSEVTGPSLDPELAMAMDRLERALAVAAPPSLAEAARAVGCAPPGVSALERADRIVLLEPDLAYAMTTYRVLADRAVTMAATEPLTPARFRDATGTSRKYVMAILADLDRRGILRRTADGHLPGPRSVATLAVPQAGVR